MDLRLGKGGLGDEADASFDKKGTKNHESNSIMGSIIGQSHTIHTLNHINTFAKS